MDISIAASSNTHIELAPSRPPHLGQLCQLAAGARARAAPVCLADQLATFLQAPATGGCSRGLSVFPGSAGYPENGSNHYCAGVCRESVRFPTFLLENSMMLRSVRFCNGLKSVCRAYVACSRRQALRIIESAWENFATHEKYDMPLGTRGSPSGPQLAPNPLPYEVFARVVRRPINAIRLQNAPLRTVPFSFRNHWQRCSKFVLDNRCLLMGCAQPLSFVGYEPGRLVHRLNIEIQPEGDIRYTEP
jgi:hypothetical protein